MKINANPPDQILLKQGEAVDKGSTEQREKIHKIAKDFESIFFELVMKSMRKSISKSELMNGGNAEDIYQGMLDSEYSKAMSQQGVGGLSQAIEEELSSKIEAQARKMVSKVEGQKVYSQSGLFEVEKK
ncbi:MAG: rod-binding protein [Oligoflexales bacterium]|nr:rod-binding protein [Oligoflexales bacterium]